MKSERPLRVAYVIKEMVTGGSQTHLLQVLRLLDRQKFEPVFFCLSGQGELLDTVRGLGVEVVTPGAGKAFKGLSLLARIRELAKEFRARKIDIAHCYLLRANLVGSIAARLAGVPVVFVSKRGCHERRGYELVTAKIGNFLADRVTANAEAVREFVHDNEGCPLEKMVVIPSGVDTTRFQPLPPADFKERLGLASDRLVVGVVTRSRTRKGVEEFVRAIALLKPKLPAIHGLVVGDVTVDSDLRELLGELSIADGITFLGRRTDMPEVLSAFDIFTLASHDEGMSNAILEAMAMEKPVVATDVGGTGEVVRPRETGLLVPARDPEALARAIGEVGADAAWARSMGQTGRTVVEERFSARAMVRQMENLYREVGVGKL